MRMNKKSYLECLYDYGDYYASILQEVSERNPSEIFDDGRIIGCRYFDRMIISYDGQEKNIDTNYSSWIWFGEKCTLNELMNMNDPKYNNVMNYMVKYRLYAICLLRNGGYQPLGSGNEFYGDVKDQMTK